MLMNWVQFQDIIFNLEHVTHFYVIGSEKNAEITAYLNFGYPGMWGIGDKQHYIIVGKGKKEECKKWLNDILAGEYNIE